MSGLLQQRLPFLAPPPSGNARRNLVIEAGAGTGKTTAIVREVVELLLERKDQQLDRVVLVTFTEKAAAEISERIREALVDLHSTFDSGDPRWPSDAEQPILRIPPERAAAARVACETHLGNIDRLRSQTIHSFCQSLLQMYPIEAHLSPSFRLVSGFDRDELYAEIYDRWLERETNSDDPEVLRDWRIAYGQFGTLESIRGVVFDFLDKREIVADPSYSLGDLAPLAGAVGPRIDALNRLSEEDVELIEDPAQLAAVQYVREHPLPEPSVDAWVAWFEPLDPLLAQCNFRKGTEEVKLPLQWLSKTEVKATVATALKSHVAGEALRRIAIRFFTELDAEKEQRSLVDFDDLLLRAARLIESPAVLEALRQKFDFIFVDEFQDTDRVQARIIEALARRADGSFVDGRITLVGDPKQSIYSFRRADPETYAATIKAFVAGGAQKQFLSKQYRSDAPLVEALNAMFSRAFPHGESSDENVFRPEYTPLEAAQKGVRYELQSRITFLTTSAEEGGAAAEAEAICSYLARTVSSSKCAWKRFAILLKNTTHLDAYADALGRAGIPFALPPLRPFFEQKVVVQTLAVVRAIAFPFDEAARIAAFRSPYFGFSDDEILHHVVSCKEGATCPIDAAARLLRELGEISRGTTVEQTLLTLFDLTRIRAIFELTAGAGEALALLERLLDVATEFDRTRGGSLAQFADDVAARRRGAGENDRNVPDENVDAVRIMTVHASKGLEFETVIIPDLANEGGRDRISAFTVAHPRHLVLTGRAGSLSRFARDNQGRTLATIEKERATMETGRLFYVAVTRAQSDVVFVARPDAKRTGFWRCLADIFEDEPKNIVGDSGGEEVREINFGSVAVPVRFLSSAVLPAFTEGPKTASRLRDPEVEAIVSPASAPMLFERDITVVKEQPLDATTVRIRLAAADRRGFGIAVHRFLELWDGTDASVERLIENVSRENLLSVADRHLVQDTIRRAIASESWKRLASSGDLGREMPFHVPVGGTVEERRIDRLIRLDGTLHVVDFKTGQRRGPRFERDCEQVRAYAEVIASIAGETCSGLLWYVDAGREELIEVPPREA